MSYYKTNANIEWDSCNMTVYFEYGAATASTVLQTVKKLCRQHGDKAKSAIKMIPYD